MDESIVLAGEVREAVNARRPVVALETAVVTHGLPHPRNLEACAAMEAAIRAEGAVPAVCLVFKGKLLVGATERQIAEAADDPAREKAAVRDLGWVLSRGATAGLTVSATLFAASLAGINVFATGGIGGVHRGAERTGDISADLPQLARSPVITVCAGAKSVLDIPRTLEYLETEGVPVFGYRTATFPAFYLRSSGQPVTCVDDEQEIALAAAMQWRLGYSGGMVVGVPIPDDESLDPEEWKEWLAGAEVAASDAEIRGKTVTPYLLDHLANASQGRTVQANLALLQNNARIAARIAAAMFS